MHIFVACVLFQLNWHNKLFLRLEFLFTLCLDGIISLLINVKYSVGIVKFCLFYDSIVI